MPYKDLSTERVSKRAAYQRAIYPRIRDKDLARKRAAHQRTKDVWKYSTMRFDRRTWHELAERARLNNVTIVGLVRSFVEAGLEELLEAEELPHG